MTYLSYINERFRTVIGKGPYVLYGQNISRGSSLGGLSRDVVPGKGGLIINSTNAESTLAGIGFGMMLEQWSSVFFMKQLDFLLLGVDQLVNTFNNIRSASDTRTLGSYTIVPIIVDSGYQGPQSSFNNFADVCTIAKIRGYTLSTKWDIDRIIAKVADPGFRIIAVSQRQFKDELLDLPKPLAIGNEETVFHYLDGKDMTIVAFNFALPQALKLQETAQKRGMSAALFNVNSPADFDRDLIITHASKTKKLFLIDDSKSDNLPQNQLLADPRLRGVSIFSYARELGADWLHPVADTFEIDAEKILTQIQNV